jgi:hypothetical protein
LEAAYINQEKAALNTSVQKSAHFQFEQYGDKIVSSV